jgi:multimeric flavodoxin WrbA
MRILAIHGSPRKDGNSDALLECFLKSASDSCDTIERVSLRELKYSPCTECDGCKKTGQCVLSDMLGPLFEKLLAYERVVFSYPLFFLGPPALTKAFIDRGQFLWVRKYILGIDPVKPDMERKAFLLSVGGYRGGEKVFRCNRSILKSFLPVCGLTYGGDLFQGGMEEREDVRMHEDLCNRAGTSFCTVKVDYSKR